MLIGWGLDVDRRKFEEFLIVSIGARVAEFYRISRAREEEETHF